MKILYVANSYDLFTKLWVEYFAKAHEVFIISDKKMSRNELTYPDNVTIAEVEGCVGSFLNRYSLQSQKLRHVDMLLSAKRYVREIKRIIDLCDIDIVHAHSLYYGYLASFIERMLPVVFSPMGSDIIVNAQNNRLYKYLAKRAFSRADVVTNDSMILQRSGYKVGARKDNNYIIQKGVYSDVFFPRKSNIRDELGIPDDTTLLFSPRGIADLYNLDDIIRALCLLKKDGFNFKCMFAYFFGYEQLGYYKKLVEEMNLEDQVVWLGAVDYMVMPDYYNASDIVLSVPSTDSSPKSVYEAMFCGTPVIISDLPWCHECLIQGEEVLTVDVKNYKQLANMIERLAHDNELYQEISRNAQKKARMLYSYENNMNKMEEIMHQAIDEYRGVVNA